MNAQRDLFPIFEVSKTRTFTEAELSVCHSLGDAYRKTIDYSGMNRKKIVAISGIAYETLSMMCTGIRNVPALKQLKFYDTCQNIYAIQWQAYQYGKILTDKKLLVEEKAILFDQMQGMA